MDVVSFLGAADTVTGSRTLLSVGKENFLVDCGLFQGTKPVRMRNWKPFDPPPETIDAVIITHAHLDHTGYLPRLVKSGYRAPIHASSGTVDLSRVLLMDAAYLETEHALYANKTGYSNHQPAMPLFDQDDAEAALKLFQAHERGEWFNLGRDLEAKFLRAGHIIGASMAHFRQKSTGRTVTFSGDLGNFRSHILKGPVPPPETDLLVLESSYGSRRHPRHDVLDIVSEIANRTFDRGGVLVIPAFAVGRAQEVTYLFRQLEDAGKIPVVPVYLDSPMANQAMEICLSHPEDQILDSAFLGTGDNFRPAQFEVLESPDESMMGCMRDGPLVIISASGMLAGGRILHHLKTRLPDHRNTILFTGYQAEGTKGRFLQDNVDSLQTLRIHHKEVEINCDIEIVDALSAHADYDDILNWLEGAKSLPKEIIVNHGTPDAQRILCSIIERKFTLPCHAACDLKDRTWRRATR